MAKNNDDRIIQLKVAIQKEKDELATQKPVFEPKTNCMLVLNGQSYNLHVSASEELLLLLEMYIMAATNLKKNPDDIMISGYSLSDWFSDVEGFLKVQKYKSRKNILSEKERQLTKLLSDDKKTELEIDAIAQSLGL